MSGKIMGQVWDFDLPTNEQLVLLAMADHADHVGENIYPSVGLIAWKTGYSERTIQRLIKSLLKKEILKVQKRRPGKTTIYCTAFENAPLRQPYRSEQTPDTNVTPDIIDVTPTPDIQMSPEPSLEPSTKIKDSIASPDGNAAGDDVFHYTSRWSKAIAEMVLIPDTPFYANLNKAKRYISGLMECGLVMLDMDWNEVLAIVKQALITPPDAPQQEAKKERPANPWYDAILATMNVPGFKNGNIGNVLRATGKNGLAKYNLETPLTDPEQVHIFWAWYETKCPGCDLISPAAVQTWVMRWQGEGCPDVRPSQREIIEDDIEWVLPSTRPVIEYVDKTE